MRAALQGGGLDDLFTAVVTGEDVSRGRPDPEPYLLAAQEMGRPPVRCVIIGNSNQVGGSRGTADSLSAGYWAKVDFWAVVAGQMCAELLWYGTQ